MKINVNYLENEIDIVPDCVFAIEIENKKYFYRLTHELYNIYQGIVSNEITLYDDGNQEITGTNKIKIFINYFDFQLDSKKYINDISKYIENNISEENKMKLINEYKKIISLYKRALNEIDLPICINPDFDVESLTKLLKIKLEMKNEIYFLDIYQGGDFEYFLFLSANQYLYHGKKKFPFVRQDLGYWHSEEL